MQNEAILMQRQGMARQGLGIGPAQLTLSQPISLNCTLLPYSFEPLLDSLTLHHLSTMLLYLNNWQPWF